MPQAQTTQGRRQYLLGFNRDKMSPLKTIFEGKLFLKNIIKEYYTSMPEPAATASILLETCQKCNILALSQTF